MPLKAPCLSRLLGAAAMRQLQPCKPIHSQPHQSKTLLTSVSCLHCTKFTPHNNTNQLLLRSTIHHASVASPTPTPTTAAAASSTLCFQRLPRCHAASYIADVLEAKDLHSRTAWPYVCIGTVGEHCQEIVDRHVRAFHACSCYCCAPLAAFGGTLWGVLVVHEGDWDQRATAASWFTPTLSLYILTKPLAGTPTNRSCAPWLSSHQLRMVCCLQGRW